MKSAFAACCLLGALVATAFAEETSTKAPKAGIDAKTAFEKLKTLDGDWKVDAEGGHAPKGGKISYKVTAAGSVVMETQFAGTDHEMISMYHLDGDNPDHDPLLRRTKSAEDEAGQGQVVPRFPYLRLRRRHQFRPRQGPAHPLGRHQFPRKRKSRERLDRSQRRRKTALHDVYPDQTLKPAAEGARTQSLARVGSRNIMAGRFLNRS